MDEPTSEKAGFWRSGEVWFMLVSVLLVIGIVLVFALMRGMVWWLALPMSVVVGAVLVAASHASLGGGGRVVEIGCSSLIVAILLFILLPVFERARGLALRKGAPIT